MSILRRKLMKLLSSIERFISSLVSGVPSLSLPDAVSSDVKSLIAYGGTEQNGTPTPSSPVDIVCNNGTIKARHQSGLPLGYTLLDYIQSSNAVINDIYAPTQDTEITTTFAPHGISTDAIANNFNGVRYGFYYNINWYYAIGRDMVNSGVTTGYSVDEWTTVRMNKTGFYVNGTLVGSTVNTNDFTADPAIVFARGNSVVKWRSFIVRENSVLVMNLIPAQNLNGVVGMYDLVSGQFLTSSNSYAFVAGSTVSDPIEIYTDGLQETIVIEDNNNTTISTATTEMLLKVGDYQDQQDIINGIVTRRVGIKVFDGTESFINGNNGWISETAITDQLNATYIPYCTHFAGTNNTPQLNSNTVRVYYTVSTGKPRMYFGLDKTIYTSTTVFKQWLADQYAAGTPVIVVYPLAEETTETVSGQPMRVTEGDNIADITQASMSGLELSTEYYNIVPIQYIEFNGTQYIDTGIIVDQYDTILADAKFNSGATTNYNTICDAIDGSGGYIFLRITKDLTRYFTRFGSTSSAYVDTSIGANRNLYELSKNSFKVNDSLVITSSYSSMPNSKLIIGYIASNTQFVGRLYSFSITNSQNQKRLNFIPVRVGIVGYMYDTVSGQLFGNDGTGDFILGPDI